MRRTSPAFAALLAISVAAPGAAGPDYVRVPGAHFASVLPVDPKGADVQVASFQMKRTPVTNAEFQRFVADHPEWRRDRAPALFVDSTYLHDWESPERPARAALARPVVRISWFAATAYCEAQGDRLPTWHEWEWAAAADERQADARQDPAWRQRILNWYSATGDGELAAVASGRPNVHGIHDLHGLIWEWVQDHSAMMVSGDNREQGDPDLMKFCGAGALSMEQKENYAVLMRIAMLSSLEARHGTANVGFRCVRDETGALP